MAGGVGPGEPDDAGEHHDRREDDAERPGPDEADQLPIHLGHRGGDGDRSRRCPLGRQRHVGEAAAERIPVEGGVDTEGGRHLPRRHQVAQPRHHGEVAGAEDTDDQRRQPQPTRPGEQRAGNGGRRHHGHGAGDAAVPDLDSNGLGRRHHRDRLGARSFGCSQHRPAVVRGMRARAITGSLSFTSLVAHPLRTAQPPHGGHQIWKGRR
jgi:hypothetical protein